MKINHQLQKFISIAISQHNEFIRSEHNCKIEAAKKSAVTSIEPMVKQHKALQKRRDQINHELTKLEKQITDKGFSFEGYSHKQNIVANDLKKLGYNIPAPAYRSEKQIVAMLLAADEKKGKEILATIGVVV